MGEKHAIWNFVSEADVELICIAYLSLETI